MQNVLIFSKKKTDIFTGCNFHLWWDFQKQWPIMQPTNNMTQWILAANSSLNAVSVNGALEI